MSKEKLLIIGDLRKANNWGAVGSTTELINAISQRYDLIIETIEHKSFNSDTPENGWNEAGDESLVKKIRNFIISLIPRGSYIEYLLRRMKEKYRNISAGEIEVHDSIPVSYEEYQAALEKFTSGEILQYERKMMDDCNYILINGEGSVVNGTDSKGHYRRDGRYVFFMAYLAKKAMGKPCFLINHTVDPKNKEAEEIIRKVYPLIDYISVREPESIKELRRIGFNGKVDMIPDSLFLHKPVNYWNASSEIQKEIDINKPYICLGDSSGIHKVEWNLDDFYDKLIPELKKIVNQVVLIQGGKKEAFYVNLARKYNLGRINIDICSYKDLYQLLSKAEIYISGRWHNTILSALGGTPFLLWGADSHKTRGLNILLNYPYSFYDLYSLPEHIDSMMDEIRRILSNRNEISQKLVTVSRELQVKANLNITFLDKYIKS